MVVDGKADQTDVKALKAAMDRLNATIAAKAKGSSATAARDAEALGALQAAFKDMSTSMEGSMRKLQQVCLFQCFSGRPLVHGKLNLNFGWCTTLDEHELALSSPAEKNVLCPAVSTHGGEMSEYSSAGAHQKA